MKDWRYFASVAVLPAKEPTQVEVYNDIGGDLVNLFRVLRDPALFDAEGRAGLSLGVKGSVPRVSSAEFFRRILSPGMVIPSEHAS